jgi:hypothetical protein
MSDFIDLRNHIAVVESCPIPSHNSSLQCKLPILWCQARKIKKFAGCAVYWDGPPELSEFGLSQKSLKDLSSRWMMHNFEGQFCVSPYFESNSLVSVLACLANCRPDTIRRCFGSETQNSDPTADNETIPQISYEHEEFSARLWLNGKWSQLKFDDKLPCRVNGQHLSSNTVNDFEYFPWVPFIEKAVATILGGFDLIRRSCFESAARQVQLSSYSTCFFA